MVQLIPDNNNPTRINIDTYILENRASSSSSSTAALKRIVREIQSKSGAGALLHPAEEYFVERYLSIL
jgi:hypothetical protein